MFERFYSRPSHEEAPQIDIHSQLESINARIAELQENISKWGDSVPADRALMEELISQRNRLETELATQDHDTEGKTNETIH
jgi:chromosome segregation ATPase